MKSGKIRNLVMLVVAFAATAIGAFSGETVFKFGHCHPTASQYQKGALKFAELVSQKTNGGVKVSVYANSQIGDEAELTEGVKLGTVDMGLVAGGFIAKYNSDFHTFDLPYLFRDYDHVDNALGGPIGAKLTADTEKVGIKIMSWWESGFRHYLNNKHEVKTPADMVGLKIRTPDWPALIASTKLLGANPVPMPFSELYMACQQGVVDGQEGPPFAIRSAKMYEVQKYMVLDGHTYTVMAIIVNPAKFAKLSEKNQKAVLEAGLEAGAYQRALIRDQVEDDLKFVETEGRMVIFRNPDKSQWIEATKAVYDQMGDRINKELVTRIRDVK